MMSYARYLNLPVFKTKIKTNVNIIQFITEQILCVANDQSIFWCILKQQLIKISGQSECGCDPTPEW